MKKKSHKTSIIYLLLAFCFFESANTTPVHAELRAEFSEAPEELLISYNLVPHMLGQKDTIPLIRVYGDGTVLIHYPQYSPQAGDYTTSLTQGELQKLLNMVTDKGLANFKSQEIADKHLLVKTEEVQQGLFYEVSEVDETRIEVHLAEFQESPDASVETNIQRKIRWNNLHNDVKRYPELEELRKLSEAEKMLRQLLVRKDLKKLER
ncbi:MAG: hypothetical protein SD837_10490 [Candidatus Electrothrix scaldis]|nr:MAG: hypothetical protein SD837_10490 [Candidatus Electrothrix sp. GW3-3]